MQKLEGNFFVSMPPVTNGFAGATARSWRDRSNIVNYMERTIKRLHDYGVLLNYSNTDQETQQKEKERLKQLFRDKINAA